MKFGKRFDWAADEPARDNAARVLPELAAAYLKAGGKARSDSSSAKLHEFRLMTKRFRYTLELFRPVYGSVLEERISQLRKIQDALGVINDCAVFRARLAGRPEEEPEALLASFLDARLAKKLLAFRRLWSQFTAAGEQEKWMQVLGMLPPEPAPAKPAPSTRRARSKRTAK